MTKAEQIERYGLEWYEEYKVRSNERSKARKKERYHNDPEFREYMKVRNKARRQIPEYCEYENTQRRIRYNNEPEYRESKKASSKAWHKARYAEGGHIDLIENYELAVKDNFEGWVIHHRLELHPDCTVRFTKQSLIKLDLYYNRPPSELIWLREIEHKRMHGKLGQNFRIT